MMLLSPPDFTWQDSSVLTNSITVPRWQHDVVQGGRMRCIRHEQRQDNRDNTIRFNNLVMQIERAEWRPTLAGCKAIIHQHLDTTLTLMIAGHRVGHYSAEGTLLTPLTKKQIKAVEKTLKGKVQKQTFPFNLQIPQNARDSHFTTASTTADD
jgi:hypothetical protein